MLAALPAAVDAEARRSYAPLGRFRVLRRRGWPCCGVGRLRMVVQLQRLKPSKRFISAQAEGKRSKAVVRRAAEQQASLPVLGRKQQQGVHIHMHLPLVLDLSMPPCIAPARTADDSTTIQPSIQPTPANPHLHQNVAHDNGIQQVGQPQDDTAPHEVEDS